MGMSNTLREYLEKQGARCDLVRHPRSLTSMETAPPRIGLGYGPHSCCQVAELV